MFNLRFRGKRIDCKFNELKYSYPLPFVGVCRGSCQGRNINKGGILGKFESN